MSVELIDVRQRSWTLSYLDELLLPPPRVSPIIGLGRSGCGCGSMSTSSEDASHLKELTGADLDRLAHESALPIARFLSRLRSIDRNRISNSSTTERTVHPSN